MDNVNSYLQLFEITNLFQRNTDENPYSLKLNNCSNLKFFKDELTIKYIGKGSNTIDYASVQANKPIDKNAALFYYEVEILDEGSRKDITIGFSDKEFVLNKQCGMTSRSFGLNGGDGKIYHEKAKGDNFSQKFKNKEIIGCGYFFSKNSIFYTCNGKFLGWAFKNVEFLNYFATVSLHSLNEKVCVNFGKKGFIFDLEGFYIQQTKEKLSALDNEKVDLNDLDYIIKEYLVHSGYQETFNVMDIDHTQLKGVKLNDETIELKKTLSLPEDDILIEYDNLLAAEDYVPTLNEKMLRRKSSFEDPKKQRSISMMMERLEDSKDKTKDIMVIMNFLEERNIIQNMVSSKKYKESLNYFEKTFHEYKNHAKESSYKKIILCISCLIFLDCIQSQNYDEAFEVLDKLDQTYWSKNLSVSLYDKEGNIIDFSLEDLSVLLSISDVNHVSCRHFFNENQIPLIGNQINSLILEIAGLSRESILEKVIKQNMLINHLEKVVKNSYGEVFKLKI